MVEVERQWHRLQGSPNHSLPEAPCTLGSGIRVLDAESLDMLAQRGRSLSPDRALRFIPASGAATRMFQALLAGHPEALEQLHLRWSEFPFHELAEAAGPCRTAEEKWSVVIERLALQNLPKGAMPFHRESQGIATAFEAQLGEWSSTLDAPGAHVHFSLSESGLNTHWAQICQWAEERGLTCSPSVQASSTDTLCMGEDGRPFRTEQGDVLFRPGGHGSLIHNLQELAVAHPGAMVSIKNIDNVRPSATWPNILLWRRALLGLADTLLASRDAALAALAGGNMEPARDWLRTGPAHGQESLPDTLEALRKALDRPFMVAGMVRNEGEPGGGPFWLRDDEGVLRAQIVESSEMDPRNPAVQAAVSRATHFNPVDLVCILHRPDGTAYSLLDFVDHRRDFLVNKSHAGRPLKGLEHPGLWNGAMGRWNTVFVEVSPETFAPVKTVFDLLRPAHRT